MCFVQGNKVVFGLNFRLDCASYGAAGCIETLKQAFYFVSLERRRFSVGILERFD